MPLAKVAGSVTMDGQPLTNAKVTFLPQVGPAASGELDEEGRFELSTYRPGDGAVLGIHTAIVTPISQGVTLQPGAPPTSPTPQHDVIPAIYRRKESSTLHLEVQDRGNDFELVLHAPP